MKHCIIRVVALALALVLLGSMALADVRATGDVWMRTGPGRSYDQVKSFKKGHVFKYLGETRMDERPVAWYKVSSGKYTGWVSSKYAELVNEDSVVVTAEPTAVPKPTAEPTPKPTAEPVQGPVFFEATLAPTLPALTVPPMSEAAEQPVELSVYYGTDLVTAANEVGLISYREVVSEAPYQYYDNAVILAGNQNVENIVVYGAGYEVYGVRVGMSASTAMAWLNAAGLDFLQTANGVTYEHRAAADSPFFVDANGHDSCINLWVNDENIITEIDWSTYTG